MRRRGFVDAMPPRYHHLRSSFRSGLTQGGGLKKRTCIIYEYNTASGIQENRKAREQEESTAAVQRSDKQNGHKSKKAAVPHGTSSTRNQFINHTFNLSLRHHPLRILGLLLSPPLSVIPNLPPVFILPNPQHDSEHNRVDGKRPRLTREEKREAGPRVCGCNRRLDGGDGEKDGGEVTEEGRSDEDVEDGSGEGRFVKVERINSRHSDFEGRVLPVRGSGSQDGNIIAVVYALD